MSAPEQSYRSLTFEQETRLFRALGVTKVKPSAEEVIGAAETQKRSLEAATTRTRELEAAASRRELERGDDLSSLLREVEGLRSQNRLAAKERELDRRDEAEELAIKRDMAFRLGIRVDEVV